MNKETVNYCVFRDDASMPTMYGIQSAGGVRTGHISTDYQEVNHLVQSCISGCLSQVHLCDVVEDFRRS